MCWYSCLHRTNVCRWGGAVSSLKILKIFNWSVRTMHANACGIQFCFWMGLWFTYLMYSISMCGRQMLFRHDSTIQWSVSLTRCIRIRSGSKWCWYYANYMKKKKRKNVIKSWMANSLLLLSSHTYQVHSIKILYQFLV